MPPTVESFCRTLAESHLLTSHEVRKVYHTWRKGGEERVDDLEGFTRWLEDHHYLTPYQIRKLLDGRTDHFFLDRYKVLERIGQGTMAKVYKVACPNGELFALKILPRSRARNQRWLAMFQRAAREIGRFHHPNLVRTLDAGEWEGIHYLLMEHLEGETLERVLGRRGCLSPGESVRIIHSALLGLQHIHELGDMHCNLEPAHLMLVPGSEVKGENTTLHSAVKILDVGLGEPLFATHVRDGELAREHHSEVQVQGKVDYLAPERASHAGSDIRGDVYSLGCILYHCLTGRPPFANTNVMQTLIAHAADKPSSPSRFNPYIPEGLAEIVLRMMAKDPRQRFPTPAEAADALRKFLPPRMTGQPIPLAMPPGHSVENQYTLGSRDESSRQWGQAFLRSNPTHESGRPLSKKILLGTILGIFLGGLIYLVVNNRPDEIWSSSAQAVGASDTFGRPLSDLPQRAGTDLSENHHPAGVTVPVDREDTSPDASPPGIGEDRVPGVSPVPPAKAPKVNPQLPEPSPTPPQGEEEKPSQASLPAPIPEAADQERAKKLIEELFRADYSRRLPAERHALAQKLLERGIETLDDPVARYVLFREAIDISAQLGDLNLLKQAMDHCQRHYALDRHKEYVRVYTQAARVMVYGSQSKLLAVELLNAARSAIADDEYDIAMELLEIAEPVASRSDNRLLYIQEVQSLKQQGTEIKQAYVRLQDELGIPDPLMLHEQMVGDPRVRLQLGRFLCLFKGDWSRGLPLLTESKADGLGELAAVDLKETDDPAEMVRRGDAWWVRAETEKDTARDQLRKRAVYWYELALPATKGLTKTRIEQLIQQVRR